MDKQKVLAAIAKVRGGIVPALGQDWPKTVKSLHDSLDEVIAAVGEPEKVLEKSEQSLEEHIVTHLLLRKQQEEHSQVAQKAKKVIEQLEQ